MYLFLLLLLVSVGLATPRPADSCKQQSTCHGVTATQVGQSACYQVCVSPTYSNGHCGKSDADPINLFCGGQCTGQQLSRLPISPWGSGETFCRYAAAGETLAYLIQDSSDSGKACGVYKNSTKHTDCGTIPAGSAANSYCPGVGSGANGCLWEYTVPQGSNILNPSPCAACTPPGGMIGSLVWLDRNLNGVQDTAEAGAPDVVLELLACPSLLQLQTVATDARGRYAFLNVPAGSYRVRATSGGRLRAVGRGYSDCVPVAVGAALLDVNFPFEEGVPVATASVGGVVWEDRNADGVWEAGEPGLGNVSVTLEDCNDTALVHSGTTMPDGRYSFASVAPGAYRAAVATPAAAWNSTPNPTPCFALLEGANKTDVDSGFFWPASFGGSVWDDLNANGLAEAGEPGMGNVAVTLLTCNGAVVRGAATTDSSGAYAFAGLAPGVYRVAVLPPAGAANSTAVAPPCLTLLSGDARTLGAVGLYWLAAAGGLAWEDLNANGLRDAGEPGLGSVSVTLRSCNGAALSTAVTAPTGAYAFPALPPGAYQVAFATPAGAASSTATATPCFTLASGANKADADAGFFWLAAVGDLVWFDYIPDGIQGPTEPGFPGVSVGLQTCGGTSLRNATTDTNGLYRFQDLTPAISYKLQVYAPDGFHAGPQGQGGDRSRDSDVDPATLATGCFTLTSRQSKLDLDVALFGMYTPCGMTFASSALADMATSYAPYSVPSAECFPDPAYGGWTLPQAANRQTGAVVTYGLWAAAYQCTPGLARYIGQATLQWVTSTTVTVTYQLLPGFLFWIYPEDHDVYVGTTTSDIWNSAPASYQSSTIQYGGTAGSVSVQAQVGYNYSVTVRGLNYPATTLYYAIIFGSAQCLLVGNSGGGVISSSTTDAAHLAAASSGPGSSAVVWVGLGAGVTVAAVLAAVGYARWGPSPRGPALRVDPLFAPHGMEDPRSPLKFNTALHSLAASPRFSPRSVPVVSPSSRQLESAERGLLLPADPEVRGEVSPGHPATPANAARTL